MALPLWDLVEFIEKKYAFALGPADGFHDPGVFLIVIGLAFFKFVCEKDVLRG